MSYTTLLLENRDGVATITVNRPDKLNALNAALIADLEQAVAEITGDPAIRGVILTGSGTKAFVAGADIAELATCNPISAQSLSRKGSEVFRQIERSQKPIVAAVNGFALGGGCELAMACHIRLASDTARFGQPEVKLGLTPGYGGTVRLPRLVGRGRALELLMSAAMIDAQEAWRIGLVNRVVPADQLLSACDALLRSILANGPLAVGACLRLVNEQEDLSIDDALAMESRRFGELAGTADFREGTGAFLAKRPPGFSGA